MDNYITITVFVFVIIIIAYSQLNSIIQNIHQHKQKPVCVNETTVVISDHVSWIVIQHPDR